jgi:hypothetical protein
MPVALLALGIGVAKLSTHLGVPARREDEIILTVALMGVLLFSYPRLWSMAVFWVLLFAWFGAHVLVLWIVFDLWFPKLIRGSFWLLIPEVYCMQYLLNLCRVQFLAEHGRRRGGSLS